MVFFSREASGKNCSAQLTTRHGPSWKANQQLANLQDTDRGEDSVGGQTRFADDLIDFGRLRIDRLQHRRFVLVEL